MNREYSEISIKRALYKADISSRRTVYPGTDGFTVKLLWKNLYKADSYKADSRKTDIFSCPKWTFGLKTISIKQTQVQKQFSRKKTYIFFEKLVFTMFYSLVYILNNFFHSVFCPLNCFGFQKIENLQESRVRNQHHDSHVFQLQYILLYS